MLIADELLPTSGLPPKRAIVTFISWQFGRFHIWSYLFIIKIITKPGLWHGRFHMYMIIFVHLPHHENDHDTRLGTWPTTCMRTRDGEETFSWDRFFLDLFTRKVAEGRSSYDCYHHIKSNLRWCLKLCRKIAKKITFGPINFGYLDLLNSLLLKS